MLFLLSQAALAPSTSTNDIIVVGRRAEDDLAACLTRSCLPAEEVEASLQASVEQFADGRYENARQTLQKAIKRNRAHAARLPGPVSSLYATLATVAEHLGDDRLWLSSARNDVLVLRRNAGETHKATLTEELVFADNLIGLKQFDAADAVYKKVRRIAMKQGQNDLAAGAMLRSAWLAAISGLDREAERGADEAVALAGTRNPSVTEFRDVLRARMAIRRGDKGAIDILAARLRQSATETPRLLFSAPVADINPVGGVTRMNASSDSGIRFADIGFWVRPDGRTAGAELLRNSGLGQWAPGILKHVNQRRYIPLNLEPGKSGLYRIDRFTVRGTLGVPLGSRIIQRTGDLSVHVVDLTDTDAMSAAQRERAAEATASPGG